MDKRTIKTSTQGSFASSARYLFTDSIIDVGDKKSLAEFLKRPFWDILLLLAFKTFQLTTSGHEN